MRPAFALLLCGCPYLWEDPAYSDRRGDTDVDASLFTDADTDADSDADADADADSDADADTHTGTPSTPPVHPSITAFTARVTYTEVILTFSVIDGGGDLDSGMVTLSVDGVVAGSYLLMTEVPGWDGQQGTLVLAEPATCAGYTRDYALVVTDGTGNSSASVATQVVLATQRVAEGGEPLALGTLVVPVMLCANLENKQDVDTWSFELATGGPFTVTLAHQTPPDLDVELQDGSGMVLDKAVAAAAPDSFGYTFASGTAYRFRIWEDDNNQVSNHAFEVAITD